eukprot:GEMP01009161.1.p3 GENE.GEMP01009161.1~~GEMP01009161.1.p3  ORF type:complete len:159 (+),score=31.10 GEMP01009161.1:851-1327(+)
MDQGDLPPAVPAAQSSSKPGKSHSQDGQSNPGEQITEGCTVILAGLKNAASLNGVEAEVLAIDEDKSRMDIRLKHDGSVKKVKSDNVRFVSGPTAKTNSTADELQPGQIVTLVGLRSAAALNGANAKILRKDPNCDRYEIRLQLDGSTKKVRRENLQA